MYWDVNNLYRWTMSQTLPEGGLEWVEDKSKLTKDLTKDYNEDNNIICFHKFDIEDNNIRWFLKFDIEYPKNMNKTQKDLPFWPSRMKIWKFKKPVCSLHDKKECVEHTRTLK